MHSSIPCPLPLCILEQPLVTVSLHGYRGEGGFGFNSIPPADSFWGSTGITDQNVAHPCVPGAHAAPAPVTSEVDLRLIQHGRLPPKAGEQPSSLLLGWQISQPQNTPAVFIASTAPLFRTLRTLLGPSGTATAIKCAK